MLHLSLFFYYLFSLGLIGISEESQSNQSPQEDLKYLLNCDTSNMAQRFGTEDFLENGGVLLPIPGTDAFLLGGIQQSTVVFLQVSADGTLEAINNIAFSTGQLTLLDLKWDSNSFLIGVGNRVISGSDQRGYIFRFDLRNDRLLWLKEAQTTQWAYSILEPDPDGDFLFIGAQGIDSPAPGQGDDVAWTTINRNTGEMTTTINRNFYLGGPESFYVSKLLDEHIHNIGRYSFTMDPPSFRASIAKYDLNGEEVWSRMLHVPESGSARLYSRDLIEVGDELYLTYFGDDDGGSTTQTNYYLANLTKNGNFNWIKKYEIPAFNAEQVDALLPTEDGILLVGQEFVGERGLFVSKVDFSGQVLWAKSYEDPQGSQFINNRAKSIAHLSNGTLYLNATHEMASGNQDILWIKAANEGQTGPECWTINDLEIQVTDVALSDILEVNLPAYNSNLAFLDPFIVDLDAQLTSNPICVLPCLEICGNKLDDDGDGLIDCADPDLMLDCCCREPPILGLNDTSLCENSVFEIRISDQFSSYLWSDGRTDSIWTTSESGLYSLEVTDTCGNTFSDTLMVEFLSSLESFQQVSICPGDSLELFGLTVSEEGLYAEQFMAAAGCDSVAQVEVVYEAFNPEVIISNPESEELGPTVSVKVDPTGAPYNYNWSFTTDPTSSQLNVPLGTHTLILTSNLGCTYDLAFTIDATTVNPIDSLFNAFNYFLPNVFSPNGDGVNDRFYPMVSDPNITVKSLLIVDRWGELVFESMNTLPNVPELGWDGRFNGQLLDPAVFVFVVQFEFGNGRVLQGAGDFVLIR